MNSEAFIQNYPDYRDQIAHVADIPAKDAETVRSSECLPVRLARRLEHESLYTHQATALNALSDGDDVCVTTATASGKTLVYALHIARRALENPSSTALLVYPTKALARDQRDEMASLYEQLNIDIDIGIYDGDVSSDEKRRVRNECEVIITNFQGLNYYLPHHRKWKSFLTEVETVVVDEAHMYSGLEGIHVAWILRRTLRLIEDEYNASPRVVLTSATINNPAEHAENLTGRDVAVVDEDGSPRGRRDVVLWNPPAYHDDDSNTVRRRSTHQESSDILAHLVENDVQSLMFAPSRKMTELCAKWTQQRLAGKYGNEDAVVKPYNAGHTKEERRSVEDALKQGDADGIVSTSALEVGIDVGSVDATVLDGYPGRRTSFWQRIGRAGRGTSESLAFLVARNDSIDQYIVNHPEYLLEEAVEDAVIDLSNKRVLRQHLLAAANESSLTDDDERWFGEKFRETVKTLKLVGELSGKLQTGMTYSGDERPESNINLYSTGSSQFTVKIRDDGETTTLPDVDRTRAYRDFHPGAVYLHGGEYYEVVNFSDGDSREVILEPSDGDYYTESNREVEITNIDAEEEYHLGDGLRVCKGSAVLKESYPTYRQIGFDGDVKAQGVPTTLDDSVELRTQAMWLDFSEGARKSVVQHSAGGELLASLHAAEHALIKMAPTVLTVNSDDIGGLSANLHKGTRGSAVFIYDGIEGGVGFSHTMFDNLNLLAARTATVLEECDCQLPRGCPACTMSSMCGDENEVLDRVGGAKTLRLLLELSQS